MSYEVISAKESDSPPTTMATTTKRRLGQDLLLIAAILVVLVLLGVSYARPWLRLLAPPRAELSTYVPLNNGQSLLQVTLDEAGEPIRWTSSTIHHLPVQQALSGRPRMSVGQALDRRYPGTIEAGVIPGVEVWEIRSRILEKSGELINESVVFVREDEGDLILNIQHTPGPLDLSFTPALQSGPTQFRAGQTWSSVGVRSDSLPYHFEGHLVARGPYTTSLGVFEDCWHVQSRTIISSTTTAQTTPLVDTDNHQWNCADVGLVASTNQSVDGTLEQTALLASTLLPGKGVDSSLLPPTAFERAATDAAGLPTAPARIGEPSTWTLSRLAKIFPGDQLAAHSSIPPLYIAGESPIVVSAARDSDLTAFDLSGAVKWRFHTGGTIYSPPVYDSERARIYFGSSDKHLYAVNYSGFFIWSIQTADNIATRPALVHSADGDLVVFGSEDRRLYAVDAESGTLRWQFETGGPIVSSPAQFHLADETLIVFGNDDGGVYAVDSMSGEPRWQYGVEDAVEAPILIIDETAMVASRDGVVYALEAATGVELWQSKVTRQTLRTAPTADENRIYVVDDAKTLHILDRRTGRKLRSQLGHKISGSPLLLQDDDGGLFLVAAGYEGDIVRLDLDGRVLEEWDSGSVRLSALEGADNSFEFGPAYGGGAIWLADDTGLIYRLGPPADAGTLIADGDATDVEPVSIQFAWMQQAIVFPFRQGALSYTALPYGERNLVLDSSTNLYTTDPTTGESQHVGTIVENGYLYPADPVLAGDTLFAVVDGQLFAVDPANGTVQWQHTGLGQSLTPVASDGEVVVWLTTATPEGNEPAQGAIKTLDVESGELLWEIPLPEVVFPSGVTLDRGTVYAAATPAAYDATTGVLRWTSAVDGAAGTNSGSVDGIGVGIPGVDASGQTLYICHLDIETDDVRMVAYASEDGQVLWRAPLGDHVLNPLEQTWVAGDVLVVPALDGTVLGLETSDGSERWRYAPPVPRHGAVTVAEGRVWTFLQNGDLVALDATTGRIAGQMTGLELELSTSSYVQRPLVRDDTVTVAIGLALFGYRIGP